jgi:signal transduction histidine kinase
MFTSLSHNLRTPLNGLMAMLELSKDEVNGAEPVSPRRPDNECVTFREKKKPVQSYVDKAFNFATLLLNTINDILDFTQMTTSSLRLVPAQFCLRDFLEESLRLFADEAHHKSLNLRLEIVRNAAEFVIQDRGRLQQVIVNILQNAIKFTYSGNVTLRVSRELIKNFDCVGIEITDTGIGMTRFEAQRLCSLIAPDEENEKRTSGMGLGLTITRLLVERLGPEKSLRIRSEKDQGSSFKFWVYEDLRNSHCQGQRTLSSFHTFEDWIKEDRGSKIDEFEGKMTVDEDEEGCINIIPRSRGTQSRLDKGSLKHTASS